MVRWSDRTQLSDDTDDSLKDNSRLTGMVEADRELRAVENLKEVEDSQVRRRGSDEQALVGRHREIDMVAEGNNTLAG